MVKIISTAQSAHWRSYLHRLPPGLQDIHFYPEMMLPYEQSDLGEGMLAVVEQGKEFMIQPLLKMKDGVVRHPYNFGGPVATEGFEPIDAIFPSNSIFNPFIYEHQNRLVGGKGVHVKDTVWIDLTKPFDFRQTTRHMIVKTRDVGVVIEPVDSLDNVEIFSILYHEYMESIAAAPHWFFSPFWFRVLLNQLGKSLSTLMLAKYQREVVGGCLLIHANETCYYHFAVSKREPKGIAHRMVVQAADLARFKGFKKFHLGSGVEPNDGLYTFKSGFSNLRLPIYKYECVK